jgi:anti-sigma factor RsiW
VLGALSPQDRAAFEEHLRGCAPCATAVAELAGVPGLLARVGADDARGLIDPDRAPLPVPDTLLPRLERSVRHRRRRRTAWQVAGAGLIAAACLAIGLLVGNQPSSTGDTAGPLGPPTASSSAVPQVTVALSAGGNVPVEAQVSLQDKAWGTELKLRCAYHDQSGAYPERYALWVIGQDGARFEAAGWKTAAGVPVMNITGATSLTREQIASIEVLDDEGSVLLTGTPG